MNKQTEKIKPKNINAFVQQLSEKVRYLCGQKQYEDGYDEQKTYIVGVETAIEMMCIDFVSIFTSRDTYWQERERERIKGLFPKLNPNSDSWGTTEMKRILKAIDQPELDQPITNEDNLE